jgi:hypothetical protein
MEPSLRSSSYRAVDSKLRRADKSLHETIQRFVESLSSDVRLSQYADVHFASKKFKVDKWYWLKPAGISGYLVFLPNTPVVWIDEQFKKSYKIPMRVSNSIYEKRSVFIATLNVGDSLLRLEDVWLNAGKMIRAQPFTQRWELLLDFYSLYYKPDLVLQQGMRVEAAVYESLSSAMNWASDGMTEKMMLAQSESSPRRLRVQLAESSVKKEPLAPVAHMAPVAHKEKKAYTRALFVEDTSEAPSGNKTKARAVPHAEYPDTYDVWVNDVKKGYAAVQDIELSRRLKDALGNNKELPVHVEWNEEFSMYEITDLSE